MVNSNVRHGKITQRTIKDTICYVGIGLHTGKTVSMKVQPAEVNTGINFIRKDAEPGKKLIPARWYNVRESSLCTILGNSHDVTIMTTEHLLAAFVGCGIDNALIEIDGPEVPIMDGSSEPFVSMIEKIGTIDQYEPRHAIWVQRPIEIRDGDKFAIMMPSEVPRITVSIDFENTIIGNQTLSVELVNEAFRNNIAKARSFGFADQLEMLKKRGLARGGSLQNAILVDGDRIVNEDGLRYKDEFVRHKILDSLGDLSLAGVPILGHYYAYKPGHALNTKFVRKLFEESSSWSYLTVNEYNSLTGRMEPDEPLMETDITQAAAVV